MLPDHAGEDLAVIAAQLGSIPAGDFPFDLDAGRPGWRGDRRRNLRRARPRRRQRRRVRIGRSVDRDMKLLAALDEPGERVARQIKRDRPGIDAGAAGAQMQRGGGRQRGQRANRIAWVHGKAVRAGDGKSDGRKRYTVNDDLRLLVQNVPGRQFVVEHGKGQSGAGADVRAQTGIDRSGRAGARAHRHHYALPDLAVRTDLRHCAPGTLLRIALRKMHLLAGHRLCRRCGIGFAGNGGKAERIDANRRGGNRRAEPDFSLPHRPGPLLLACRRPPQPGKGASPGLDSTRNPVGRFTRPGRMPRRKIGRQSTPQARWQ